MRVWYRVGVVIRERSGGKREIVDLELTVFGN